MTKRMLVDATHPEETRVAIVDGNWLNDFDFERTSKKQLKGNIYLAKVIRIEPSLQAAFVEYGGNRHGFLPFSEIHPDYFRIPMADRPHDEDDDYQDGEDDVHPDVAAAHAEDHIDDSGDEDADDSQLLPPAGLEHSHSAGDHLHNLNPHPTEAPAALAAAAPTVSTLVDVDVPLDTAPTAPIAGFDGDPAHDVGLITDFGNAAIAPLGEAPIPVEVVGGEVAEEAEERIRRQARPRYKIQEVVKRRQVMLIQVVKEERGNKGAALTTFLSLAGRYCVLMPNTDHGGGVSRKITNHQDRRRMKEILDQLEIPEGMAVILRTAGMEQEPAEIQRDLEYLLRLWNNIREETLQSTAPALIYEEANLIKRSIRDLYSSDVEEILVAGQRGHQLAVDFMRTIMPDQLDKVKLYEDAVPLFFRYNVEKQIDSLYSPTVQLRSGGYIVINPTEALVSIDVNSGRATRERHIESTALKTNLEAAEEVARQLRLRDLAGLVVIDFIDMEDGRNNAAVERRLKEAMKNDRARLQIGRISPFGLMELSRQRLHPSLMEINFERCPHCAGLGLVRSIDSAAISVLRMIEEEGIRQGSAELVLHVPTKIALYILNQKRQLLSDIERRYSLQVFLHSDDTLVAPDCKIERVKLGASRDRGPAVDSDQVMADTEATYERPSHDRAPQERTVAPERVMVSDGSSSGENAPEGTGEERNNRGRSRRGGRYGRGRNGERAPRDSNRENGNVTPRPVEDVDGNIVPPQGIEDDNIGNNVDGAAPRAAGADSDERRGARRRGRRGGRGRRPGGEGQGQGQGESRAQREGGNRNSAPRSDSFAPTIPAQAAAPYVPMSVHELDTTPRDYSSNHRAATPQQSSAPRPYEVVESADDGKAKGGWWRKLTGQQ